MPPPTGTPHTALADPAEPTDTAEPTDAADPADPADPGETTARTPAARADSGAPAKPGDPGESAEPSGPEDQPLRHGYTARALARLANYAATQYRYPTPLPWEERRDAAWSAIAEHLYTATEPPAYWDLIRAGWNTITAHTRRHRSTHGQTAHGSAPQFHRYWMLAATPTASPEDRVVERLALDQIWAALSPRNQELIRALDDHGDYTTAAESLGLPVSSFYSLISRARRAFTALWLEGETPTRAWGNDVRTGRDRPKHVTTTARQRTRKRHRDQTTDTTSGTPAPARAPRNRRDIGTTDTELLTRHANGESYREIADTLPIGPTAVRTRILNAFKATAEPRQHPPH